MTRVKLALITIIFLKISRIVRFFNSVFGIIENNFKIEGDSRQSNEISDIFVNVTTFIKISF